MADVVAGPGGLVAVGHFLFGQQFGQGDGLDLARRADLDADAGPARRSARASRWR